ncbi:cytochrome P450 [Mycena latifolia]|nr:cytochrome P450 [Mycena latifolia]
MSFPLALFAFVTAGAAILHVITNSRRKNNALPPGPAGEPFIGNLRQMPSDRAPLVFHEWSKTYGDVMCLRIPGQPIIVLDSLQAAEDLLEKRSAIYSDRPKFHAYELFGWTSALTIVGYGKKHAKHRQIHQSYLSRQKCVDFRPLQLREARKLVKNLYTCQSDQYETSLSQFSTGVITQIVSGHSIESSDDYYLRMSNTALESLSRTGMTPGGTAVDFFPFLRHFPRWFPGTYFVGVAEQWRPFVRELYEYPIRTVRKERESGDAKPSFVLTQLEEMDTWDTVTEEDEEDLKGNGAIMFTAGQTTTWGVLSVFMLAMVLHPACQAKAQAELDAVVGTARLPEFEDRDKLPYVEAIFQELFRWNPGVPLAIPHRCMEDNTYRGMFIPAGSLVFPNIKGMTLDENIYSNPTAFWPERYLPRPEGRAEPHFSGKFGFGRRICTGQYLGDSSVWIAVATILASCAISNAIDDHGTVIIPENEMTYGLTSHPKEFQCVIKPRTAQSKELVMKAVDFEH